MPVPVHRREFDTFLSHAHTDRAFVHQLHQCLLAAGLSVFLDETNMEGGGAFPQTIRQGIERSRGVLLIATEEAIGQGWVKREVDIALDENARDEAFRLVPLRIGGAKVDDLIRGTSWLSLDEPKLTADAAIGILRSMYPTEGRPEPGSSRDVYVSSSWRAGDQTSGRAVSESLRDQGFRLIGDSRDQEGFGDDRIERIIESCGAFVCIMPLRDGQVEASAADGPYKYFVREIDLARERGLPSIVIADPSIRRVDGDDTSWKRMETDAQELPDEVAALIDRLWDLWRPPARPHYIFLALDLDSPAAEAGSPERRLLELVTGLPTVVGNEVTHDPIQHGIVDKITKAHLVIADLSDEDDRTFNINAALEAGMAVATGRNLRLVAKGPQRRPPFMLRTVQMPTYRDDVERIALLHNISRKFRRRVINAEL